MGEPDASLRLVVCNCCRSSCISGREKHEWCDAFCGPAFDGRDSHFNDASARRYEHAGNGDRQSVLKVSLECCSSTEAAAISGLSICRPAMSANDPKRTFAGL